MPHGGKRPGAGRKPGPQTPRARDKVAAARAIVREVMADTERNPLARLLEIAYDPNASLELQCQAATALAPYCAPRLSATMVANVGAKQHDDSAAVVDKLLNRIARMLPAPTVESQSA